MGIHERMETKNKAEQNMKNYDIISLQVTY
jgi:hypothetical protein